MEKLSLAEAKNIAYDKIGIDLNDENRPIIIDDFTLDFDWGYVFYYNGKKAIETGNSEYGYIGNAPILVDKIDGESKGIGGVGQILDSNLEEYRKRKGYPHSIKFPIAENLKNKPIIEHVKALFRTGEIYQIKKGIELVQENKLFDISKFRKIVFNNAFPKWTFEESIASQFKGELIILNNGIGNEFPGEWEIFKDCTSINFSGTKLKLISEDVLNLPKLEVIEIWASEIEEITPRIVEMNSLNRIHIWDSKLGKQAKEMIGKLRHEKQVQINY